MQILATFFAFLFSFGHAQSLQHAQPHDAFIPPSEYADSLEYAVPSHRDALNQTYAVEGCPGCRMTIVSYITR